MERKGPVLISLMSRAMENKKCMNARPDPLTLFQIGQFDNSILKYLE